MKYTCLFLDLDNTLLDFNKAEFKAATEVFKKHNLPYDKETVNLYSKINLTYWERFERGEIPKSAIFEGRFKTLLQYLNLNADTKAIAEDYFAFLSEGYFTVNGAEEILIYLKSKGYKLYATTNGIAATQYKRINNSGLGVYFDDVFVSEKAGHQKPEKAYFDFVISCIPEKSKENMLIIGDSQSSDILGGINSGIDTCWYNPKSIAPKYKSTFEIKDLNQLKKIL